MANPVDVTVTQEALAQMKSLRAETIKAQEAILKLAQDALTASRNISSINTPSGLSANSANNANTSAKIQAETAKIQQSYEKLRLAELKLAQDREKAFQRHEAQLAKQSASQQKATKTAVQSALDQAKSINSLEAQRKKEMQSLERSETAYNRIQASVNILTKTYQDLAIRKQLGSTLTTKEEAQLLSLTNRLNQYQSALKKVDADIQKHGRNVGNYAGGFNGLSNSINQITRELPAFTFSAQTGFLALSNNIPILVDEINNLKLANKDLIAQGQPVKSVFSQILGSVFSLQTAMGIAILAFTLYGKEIGEFVTSLFKSRSAMDAMKEATKQMNEATKEGAKNAVQETIALKANLEIAKDVNLSYKERLIAVENLQKQYPFYFENLTKEQILAGDTAKAEIALTQAILSRAKAQAATSKITENQAKIIDLEEKRIDVVKRLQQAEKDTETARQVRGRTTGGGTVAGTYDLELASLTRLNRAKSTLTTLDEEIADLNAINNRLTSYALVNQKEAIGLDYTQTKATGELNRKKIEGIEIESRAYIGLIENIEKQIDLMRTLQNSMSVSFEQYQEFERTIQDLLRQIDNIKNGQKELRESADRGVQSAEKQNQAYLDQIERMKALQKATEEYIATFSNSFLADAGLGSLQQFFDGTFNRLLEGADTMQEKFTVAFNAITESAQEAFNFINQASQQNFDAEYRRLELQKETAIKFAGDSTSAQERINTEYDRRKREIQRREAEAQKKIAVFNILINTAQGVVSALASTPPNIPLSIAIGLIGALQAGVVQAQPIPQFFDGGTHKGGIMMVNDAKGNSYKETVVTPDGKVIKPQGRNVIMNAPAGTEIFTPEQWKAKELSLSNMLAEKGVSFNPSVLRNFAFGGSTGLSKSDFDNGISTLSKTIKNNIRASISVDKKGLRVYEGNEKSRSERLNRRFNIE